MLDITKNRSSYQRLPILKQKCKQTNVQLVPNVTKLNSYATTRAAAASNFNIAVAAAAAATTKTTEALTATKIITTNAKITKPIINVKKLNNNIGTNATTTTIGKTTTNKVRAANQLYFLTQEYKDPNFLKKECETVQSQLYINGSPKKTQRSTTLDDKHNNNNNNNNNSRKSSPSSTLLPTIVNGMRQTGQNSYLGNITSNHQQQQQSATTAKNSTTITTVHKSEQYKVLAKTVKSLTLNTTAAATPYSTNKLNSRQTTVRPLVHRTIPASAVAAANAVTFNNNNSNNNYNKQLSQNNNHLINTNNNNNNMEHVYTRLPVNTTNEGDDIKYIDSDDINASATSANNAAGNIVVVRKTCNNSTTTTTTSNKSRIRPKSTIICSATNLVFEKMNNYKMAAAAAAATATSTNNSLTVNVIPTRQSIDTSSIKASIEKFNSFSEQKRLPTNVTLRTHAASGSNSNLQHQHRHSTDFDNCNIRLPAGASNSLTRSPFRTLPSGAVITAIPHKTANSSGPVPTSKVITSMHATASAARAAALSNSLPTKTSCSSMRSQHQEQARGSTSTLLGKEVHSSCVCKIPLIKQTTEGSEVTTTGGAVITPIGVPMSGNLDNVVLKKKVVINGIDAESDSARSSSMRIPSAPLTPTSSRYYERSSNRNSTHTPSSYSSSNGEGDSGNNSLGTENREGKFKT